MAKKKVESLPFQMPEPSGQEWPELTKLAYEKQVLGMYVSGHPLNFVDETLSKYRTFDLADFEDADTDQFVKVAGIVVAFEKIVTKKGSKPMARLDLEDLTGRAPVVVFNKQYVTVQSTLGDDAIVIATARVEDNDRGRSLLVSEIQAFDLRVFVSQHVPKPAVEPAFLGDHLLRHRVVNL